MADFHFHGKVISRNSGRSAIGAAAYRSGEKLVSEYDGTIHDYTRKGGVVYSEIMLCENVPIEYQDRQTLWNAVENNATSKERLARDFDIALPIELSREEQIKLIQDYVRDNFANNGMCADFAIHDKNDGNPHAHIMLTMRPIDENGKWEYVSQKVYICKDHDGKTAEMTAVELKKANADVLTFEKQLPYFKNGKGKAVYLTKHEAENDPRYTDYVRVKGKNDPLKTKEDRKNPTIEKWDSNESFNKWREQWAVYQNREFEKKNLSVRVDHRSYEAQGIDRIPTKHMGVSAKAMEDRKIRSDRGNENKGIKNLNIELAKTKFQIRETEKEISCIRDDINWNKKHEAIANIEAKIPKTAGNEKQLLEAQAGLLRLYEKEKLLEPTKASEGRTIEYDGQQIPYFDYHKNKMLADISFSESKISQHLEAVKEKALIAKQEPPQKAEPISAPPQGGGFSARREALIEKQEPIHERPPVNAVYADEMAKRLATLRNKFVNETVRSAERTSYQPNTNYEKQANEIDNLSKTIAEQKRTIEALSAEREKLGVFKFKEKKELQVKIDSFCSSQFKNIDKLKELGVSDLSKADEAVSEKRTLAAQEQKKEQAAKLNVGAKERAEEAKAVFIEVVKQIPADQRQAVLERMEQHKEKPETGQGRLEYFKSEAEARRVLESALKEQGKDRQHEKLKGKEKERE